MTRTAQLILQDGSVFPGESFGAAVNRQGEVVFSTGMVGYPESISDPSYAGQILTFTYPLIGNYGVPDREAKNADGFSAFLERETIALRGLIVSDYSVKHSHWQAKGSLGEWLEEKGIPALSGIDTRALTRKLRDGGNQLGRIVTNGQAGGYQEWENPNQTNLVAMVSRQKPLHIPKGKKHLLVLDCGLKNNIIRRLLERNLSLTLLPWNHDFWSDPEIKPFSGVVISNGPGDPALIGPTRDLIKQCMEKNLPTFGICLGTQLMALAAGASTYKLKFGHRSHNQPCQDRETGRCYMTSQNHGFAVDPASLPPEWLVWFENLNDGTVEGIKHRNKPFFSVQFHPEAAPGPNDTAWLFDKFIALL